MNRWLATGVSNAPWLCCLFFLKSDFVSRRTLILKRNLICAPVCILRTARSFILWLNRNQWKIFGFWFRPRRRTQMATRCLPCSASKRSKIFLRRMKNGKYLHRAGWGSEMWIGIESIIHTGHKWYVSRVAERGGKWETWIQGYKCIF